MRPRVLDPVLISDARAAAPRPPIGLVFFLLCLALLAAAGAGGGCANAPDRLEPGGAYAEADNHGVITPDLAFYEVDSTFAAVDSAARLACKLERDNRALFWAISPDIKHALDKARPQILAIEIEYCKARDAYMQTPAPAAGGTSDLGDMQGILARAQKLLAAINAAIPQEARTAAATKQGGQTPPAPAPTPTPPPAPAPQTLLELSPTI